MTSEVDPLTVSDVRLYQLSCLTTYAFNDRSGNWTAIPSKSCKARGASFGGKS